MTDKMPLALNEEIALADACARTGRMLDFAVTKLDALFGAGYAKDNPELVSKILEITAEDVSHRELYSDGLEIDFEDEELEGEQH